MADWTVHFFLLAGGVGDLAGAGVFALLKWGGFMLFRRQEDPAQPPPKFPVP